MTSYENVQANPFTPGSLTPVLEASEVSHLSARTIGDINDALGSANEESNPPEYSDSGSVHSVLTEHYLAQIKDREDRLSARRNLEWLRDQGYQVRGQLVDGKYYVKFSMAEAPLGAAPDVMSLKSFVKAKLSVLTQRKKRRTA